MISVVKDKNNNINKNNGNIAITSNNNITSNTSNTVSYILGVPLKKNGRLCDELKKVYGISNASIDIRLQKSGILRSLKVGRLSRTSLRRLERRLNERYVVGPDLRRKEHDNIERHRELGTYKGIRMRAGLPVHGQRTSTNAKTAAKLNSRRCKR